MNDPVLGILLSSLGVFSYSVFHSARYEVYFYNVISNMEQAIISIEYNSK